MNFSNLLPVDVDFILLQQVTGYADGGSPIAIPALILPFVGFALSLVKSLLFETNEVSHTEELVWSEAGEVRPGSSSAMTQTVTRNKPPLPSLVPLKWLTCSLGLRSMWTFKPRFLSAHHRGLNTWWGRGLSPHGLPGGALVSRKPG